MTTPEAGTPATILSGPAASMIQNMYGASALALQMGQAVALAGLQATAEGMAAAWTAQQTALETFGLLAADEALRREIG